MQISEQWRLREFGREELEYAFIRAAMELRIQRERSADQSIASLLTGMVLGAAATGTGVLLVLLLR